jgi:hypothetical protein
MSKPNNAVGYANRRISQRLMAQKLVQSHMLHEAYDDLPDPTGRAAHVISRLLEQLLYEFDVEAKRADGDFSAAEATVKQYFVSPESQGVK